MKLPKIITAVMMTVALFLVVILVNLTKEQERRAKQVVLAGNIVVSEVKSAPQPTKYVLPPKPVKPNKPLVSQTVPLVVNDSTTLGQKNNDELVPIKQEKADGKWQIAVDQDPRLVRVDIEQQRLYYYRGGKLIYKFKCSTSMTGKVMPSDRHPDTPHDHTGVFSIGAKYVKRWSREWKVWMPWALQYIGGHYIHGTTEVQNLGSAASHGCVRLHPRDAKLLYGEVRVGDRVEVE